MEERTKKETELRDYMIGRIENEIPYTKVNGDRVKRLPNNINVCFRYVEGRSMLINLDLLGSPHQTVQPARQGLLTRRMFFWYQPSARGCARVSQNDAFRGDHEGAGRLYH